MAGEHPNQIRSQLDKLAEPFPRSLIKQAPKGKYGEYVKHSAVTERLLSIVGAFSYEIVQVIHGPAPPVIGKSTKTMTYTKENPRWPARDHAVVGCIAKLTVWVDGREVSVEEAGDVDDPAMENDGRNLKDASSDAIKRCCMRLGLGLHLWSQDDYFLDRAAMPPQPDGSVDLSFIEKVAREIAAVLNDYKVIVDKTVALNKGKKDNGAA